MHCCGCSCGCGCDYIPVHIPVHGGCNHAVQVKSYTYTLRYCHCQSISPSVSPTVSLLSFPLRNHAFVAAVAVDAWATTAMEDQRRPWHHSFAADDRLFFPVSDKW